ncbi:pantetheine-phosphate adenylyltransferase [bacterium]|nr:pantetheine-phosphate adenylyltransferase [bacterium]
MAKNKTHPERSNVKRVIYPGTFDPITNGHIDMIERSLETFDEVIVLVAHSLKKKPVFDAKVRKALIEQSFKNDSRVKVEIYDGLLADYARKHKIHAVLRGLRVVSDFEYEFQMATMNRKMNPQLQTFFLMASDHFFFVNSTLVKEVFSHGGSVKEFVPPHVEKKMREVLC